MKTFSALTSDLGTMCVLVDLILKIDLIDGGSQSFFSSIFYRTVV